MPQGKNNAARRPVAIAAAATPRLPRTADKPVEASRRALARSPRLVYPVAVTRRKEVRHDRAVLSPSLRTRPLDGGTS